MSGLPGENKTFKSAKVGLGAVIGRCLEKEAGKRYQQAGELRAELESVRAGTAAPWAAWRYRLGRRPWLTLAATFVIIAAVLVGLDVGGLRGRLTGRGQGRAIRLAVLPFANLTGDPEQEYLSDGMTEEMIAQLGRLHPQTLSVIARTSVMRYKKTDKPVDQIGHELRVDYVLEGSARREAGRIRVTAELIQVSDQAQLWADTYERELSGILALQSEVARRVSGSLALKLLPAEQTRLATVRTVNPEAYEAYIKGSYEWKKMKPADVDTAQRYFELALQKDPSYGPAYEGLAWVWAMRQQMLTTLASEAGPKAKAAALQAIALDDSSAGAHEALAMVLGWTDWNWAAAEPEWRRALELDPNAANTQAYYADFLTVTGRTREAVPHAERALELDPFNALFKGMYAVVLFYDRRYDDAIAAARAALALEPDIPPGRAALEDSLFAKDMRTEYIDLMKSFMANSPERLALLERSLAEGGWQGYHRAFADYRAARYEFGKGVGALGIADRYMRAGDSERALVWLEKSYGEHDPNLPYQIRSSLYDPVRSDARFQSILRRMNLPP